MGRKSYSEERIINKLRETEVSLSQGLTIVTQTEFLHSTRCSVLHYSS
jgi:hypothetical protein